MCLIKLYSTPCNTVTSAPSWSLLQVDEVERRLETYYERQLEEARQETAEKVKKHHQAQHQQQQLLHKTTGQPPVAVSWSSPSTGTSPRETRRDRHTTGHTTVGGKSSVGGGRSSVRSSIKDKSQAKVKR